jgi:hypothetical protein
MQRSEGRLFSLFFADYIVQIRGEGSRMQHSSFFSRYELEEAGKTVLSQILACRAFEVS